jgi:hypothetical protein
MPSLPALCRSNRAFLASTALALASIPLTAQWIRYPAPGLPRKADGTVDPSAKAPRLPDGKPDFSGIWTSDEVDARNPGVPPNPYDATTSRRMISIGAELKGGLPYQPWLADLVKRRAQTKGYEDPHVACMPDNSIRSWGAPHLIKTVHTPMLLVLLNEWNASYRQIFIDGRPLPEDPFPTWQGYSTAKWDGDTLVVDSIGFRDDTWIDWNGSVITESAKVREEYSRPDLGHMQIKLTVDDPKAYTKPWTVTIKERLITEAELIDEMCLENEKSLIHMKK